MKRLKISLIGAGWMGCSHAKGFSHVKEIYGDEIEPVFETVVDTDEPTAKSVCSKFNFAKWSTEWKSVIDDPEIDIVIITTPTNSHVEIASAAANAKKHILCEKPLGMDAKEAKKALDAIKKSNVTNMIGFLYIQNPLLKYAKKLVDSGELGQIISFRGRFDMDDLSDSTIPHTWRQYSPMCGALGDVSPHVLSISDYLVGDIEEVCAISDIVYTERIDPNNPSNMLPVENEDQVNMIYRYKNGAIGNIVASRVATGQKVNLSFELQGTNGAICFTQERMNELQLYRHMDAKEEQGFKLIRINPSHGDYRYFQFPAGLGIDYTGLVTIQAYNFLKAVSNNEKVKPDFETGWKINMIMDASLQSINTHKCVKKMER